MRLSEQCFALTGLAPSETPLADWLLWTRLSVEERGRVKALFGAALGGSRQLAFETRVVHADGAVEGSLS